MHIRLFAFFTALIFSFSAIAGGHIAVANRGIGSVSIIDTQLDVIERTLTLPQSENPAEPMYVTYKENRLYVGDRANNRVVVYDSFGFNLLAEIPAGQGVFHMWAADSAQRLLVVNDLDNTVTVIDTNTLEAIATITMPDDLTLRNFKPHDIFVSDSGNSFFVSFIDGLPGNDYVVKYWLGRNTVTEVARSEVGGDPHLFIQKSQPYQILVATQDNDSVSALSINDLSLRYQIEVPNAHGIFALDRRLYLTNISDGGVAGLQTLDARRFRVIDEDDTLFATPHNISVTDDGSKIYVTHSGATQHKVSVFKTKQGRMLPEFVTELTVGFNPFGLAYIPH